MNNNCIKPLLLCIHILLVEKYINNNPKSKTQLGEYNGPQLRVGDKQLSIRGIYRNIGY
jgi:hypothetical protein